MLQEVTSQTSISGVCPPDEGFPVFLCDDIPSHYYHLSMEEIWQRGFEAKAALGDEVFVLAHHYQRDETFRFGDAAGDSLNLAQIAANQTARYIIFCGVHFMAESADILTTEGQSVILPNITAGCSMADMADVDSVEECWDALEEICGENSFIPVTYINSSAALKAFCGAHGGTVCTSSNADKILTWALEQNKKVLFFPDQHLGRNTANTLGIAKEQIQLWKRHKPQGGLTEAQIQNSRVMLWNGFCSVHARFNVAQIHAARRRNPAVKVIVHPECAEDVVGAADYHGSTNKIIQVIRDSSPGTSWVVGTEINMVNRLHQELYSSEGKHIECLNTNVCPCSTMYRTHPANVLWVLDNLLEGKVVNQIKVPYQTAEYARKALQLMLELS
ncbi:MAG: quinolinate synthase NadA [SAR324 cluster bacterium]|nr:quinolinate synthase NadA [SAR324 cluster bacterium]